MKNRNLYFKKFTKIGILGGMGPEAGIRLTQLILESTDAKIEQNHIPYVLYNFPQIPDRTEAIRHNYNNILDYLLYGISVLKQSGVEYIYMPCNTVHYFYDTLVKHTNIKLVNLIEKVWINIERYHKGINKVGLLATEGTVESKIYEKYKTNKNIELVYVDDNIQKNCINNAIYGEKGIKRIGANNFNKSLILKAIQHLKLKGAEAVVLGCTELSISIKEEKIYALNIIDSLKILARDIILNYKNISSGYHNAT